VAGGRLVAIKAFRLDVTPEQAAELAVELEDLAANQPRHPGIAAALAAGVEGITPYLAQEYVAGEALDAVLRQFGPPPPAEALATLRRVADGLDRAAGDAIHHGMLHPRDILVAEAGDARVIDLGVAQALIRSGLRVPTRRPYSAPECVGNGEWSGAADIFSLGAIAYELLTGRRLAGPGHPEVEIPGLTAELNAKVSDALARALDEDPAARYPSAADLVDALTPLVPTAKRTTRRKTRPPDLNVPLPLSPDPESRSASLTGGAEAPPPQQSQHAEEAPEERGAETVVMDRFEPAVELLKPPAAPPAVGDLSIAPPSPAVADRFSSLDDEPVALERASGPAATEREGEQAVPFEWRSSPPPDASPIERRPYLPLAMALLVGVAAGFGWGYWTAFRSISAPDRSAAASPSAPAAAAPAPVRVEEPEVIGERNLPSPAAAAPPSTTPAPERVSPRPPRAAPEPPVVAEAAPVRTSPAPARDMAPGRLTIRSTPAGAAVRVDGRLRGRTPLVLRDLPLRVVRVTVVREGYQPDDRRVALSAARPSVTVDAELSPVAPAVVATTGALVVDSRPVGATVFLDGRAVGVTPLSLPVVEPGTRRITLQLDGFNPWVTTAQVQAGARTRVAASLERGIPE
jgi:serine/threonine protein kinase